MIATILKKFNKYSVGDRVAFDDIEGTPKELFWRKRLRDGDIEIVGSKAVEVEPPTVEETKPTPKPTKAKVEE